MENVKTQILLVEDDPNLGFVIKDNLSDKGYDITHCINGLEAERAIYKEKFDLYLFDVMMPKKSGFEVCEALRADPARAGLIIVMLTAKGRDTEVAKGLAIGADAYVTKPFSTKDLLARVKSMLGLA